MKYARGEQRQHIALSHHAHEILLSDISAFSEKGKLSGIINAILNNYSDISDATISLAVIKKKEQITETLLRQKLPLEASLSKNEGQTIDYLVNDYRNTLIAKHINSSFPKDVPFKLRLQNYIFDTLNEGFPDLELYQSIGNYIKAIVEDYCLQDYHTREQIYFRQIYERLQAEITAPPKERSLLHIRIRGVSKSNTDFRVKPYRMSLASESQFNYLVALSKRLDDEQNTFIPAVFRLSRIESIRKTPSSGSGKINRKEMNAVETAIEEKGVQFITSSVKDFEIILSPKGMSLYNTILHLRPIADNSKTSIDRQGNVTLHFRSTSHQILNYFFQFGKEAHIVNPKNDRIEITNKYRSAYESYI